MEGEAQTEGSAFYLKAEGKFKEALKAYATEYADSLKHEATFVAEACFREMFDTALLLCLQEGQLFETKEKLVAAVHSKIVEALSSVEAHDDRFGDLFRHYQGKLIPRGRAKAQFSVDARLLLRKERQKLEVSG